MDFSRLETFDDWSMALDDLLGRAQDVIQDGDTVARKRTQGLLREFRRESPPGSKLDQLDDIARKAIRDIAIRSTDDAIAAITERTSELDDVIVEVKRVTGDAKRHASLIDLSTPTTIVKSLTDTVGALKELRDGFEPGTNADEISKRVAAAISSVMKLREVIDAAT